VGVKSHLTPFLPVPVVTRTAGRARNGRRRRQPSEVPPASEPAASGTHGLDWKRPKSIGKLQAFWGNFGMLVRAYTYIRTMGPAGLRSVSDNAVLNANYVMKRLEAQYEPGAPGPCMHECVLSARRQKQHGVTAMDVAKRLLDFGFYAPSTYFPLIVDEALMIEPTETESRETLDAFCDAMLQIAREAETTPEVPRSAPVTTPVRRLDQTLAARQPNLRWRRPADGRDRA
jgi:glycine dehydrogenase subunit 2